VIVKPRKWGGPGPIAAVAPRGEKEIAGLIYIYILGLHIYININIYIYRERERQRERTICVSCI
jgi:hypothetical protein